jgi:hypothetical protein
MLPILIEVVGWSAAALILIAYAMLSSGRIGPRSAAYQAMNIAGAIGFIVNSGWNHALPSVGLNLAWLAIGLAALVRARAA